MTPPRHGGQLRHLAQTHGLDPTTILDFSANINPEGPSQAVLTALRNALEDPATLSLYPDLELLELRQAIASHLIDIGQWDGGLAPETWVQPEASALTPAHIAVANGFVPLLEAAVRALGLSRTLLPVPAFSEYRTTLERCRAIVLPHPLDQNRFAYDPARLAHDLAASAADSLLLANPQNPSGVLTPARAILEAAERHPHVTILLDEAFIDYVPGESVIHDLQTHPNLVVFRSVTKFFAIPGLRVAYTAGHPETMARLRRELAPWPVSTLAAVGAIAALEDTSASGTIERNLARRRDLVQQLGALGITCPEPAANFLLLRLPCPAAPLWQRLLEEHHILLRRCDNFEGLNANYLRTAIRGDHDNARLVAALAACLQHPSTEPPSF